MLEQVLVSGDDRVSARGPGQGDEIVVAWIAQRGGGVCRVGQDRDRALDRGDLLLGLLLTNTLREVRLAESPRSSVISCEQATA